MPQEVLPPTRNLARERKRNREKEARRLERNRDAINARRRDQWPDRREAYRRYNADLREMHFFRWRARLFSARWRVTVTAAQLARLWLNQRGRCALTGRTLGRRAHLGHVRSIAEGDHSVANLRWLDPQVNIARSNLPDAEFVQLCREVVACSEQPTPRRCAA